MDMIETAQLRHNAMLERIAQNLSVRLSDLGVYFSVRDDEGMAVGRSESPCEFCRMICDADASCSAATAEAAATVSKTKAPELATSKCGCAIVALPVKRRRRVIGSVVACMPVASMLDEEYLARICDKMQLDREYMSKLGQEACDRAGLSPKQLAGLLEQMLGAETACHTSTDELATLSNNLATTYEELSLVYRISGSMQLTQRPKAYLQNVCEELVEVMGVSTAVAIVYPNAKSAEAQEMIVVAGGCGLDDKQLALLASKYMVPRFGDDNRGVVDNHFQHEEDQWPDGQIRRLVSVPLVADGPPCGILISIDKLDREFDSVDLKLLSSIGNQSAVFLANSRLYGDLQDLLMGVLHALSATIDAKDPYTCGHSRRVALISRRLAEKVGFDAERVHRIYLAGLLHDIGKIGVPEAVLCKAGKLTDDEYTEMKSHPLLGAKILGGIRQLDDIIPGILSHHERLDGKGYPNGLHAEELSMDSLIVGLADSFDAMTSDRIYRKDLPIDVVRKEIEDNAGLQFDGSLVVEFLSWDLDALLDELHMPAETVVLCDDPGGTK
ncbi:MAG: HD domain-containing protein [Phycisphaerae bacterium]|jgi:putative nucleotidyltransferase with HDIG domain|nr:HD domain-containing protein [Phycisphaerae bacterium]